MMAPLSICIVIPTYERGTLLLATVQHVLRQERSAAGIVVVDQTGEHPSEVESQLREWDADGIIRWVRQQEPSIVRAMNRGLAEASSQIVLFLDDDVVPDPGLIEAHVARYSEPDVVAVVGKVLQPGERPVSLNGYRAGEGIWKDLEFRFNGSSPTEVANVMAGNLSVRRDRALEVGGFDENFVGVAYRFETEFCRRLIRGGGKVLFEPKASIRHLAAQRGGAAGQRLSHLRSASPIHSVGDYYFAFRESSGLECLRYCSYRMYRSVRTRFHLTHPWYVPIKLVGEVRGLLQAWSLSRKPPSLISNFEKRISKTPGDHGSGGVG